MNPMIAEEEAAARAFAQGLVAVVHRNGTTIDATMMVSLPDGFWPAVCEWLNERDIKTTAGHDWTIENALRFWERNKETVMGMGRELSGQEPVSPATQRILELWDDGIPVIAILAIVTQEGFTDGAGGHFSLESVAETIDAHAKRQLPISGGQQVTEASITADAGAREFSQTEADTKVDKRFGPEPAIPGIPDVAQSHAASCLRGSTSTEAILANEQFVTKEQLRSALTETREAFSNELNRLANAIRKELQDMLVDMAPMQQQSDELPQIPPQAPLKGLKKLGSRVKVAGTIDAQLMQRLESERKVRNISLSAMIDTMAWHYFGRPRLSFELSSEDEGTDSA